MAKLTTGPTYNARRYRGQLAPFQTHCRHVNLMATIVHKIPPGDEHVKLFRPMTLALVTAIACVAPSTAPVSAGTIRLGNVEATAVATAPNPDKYEELAARELVAYLEEMSGKKLKLVEIVDKVVPPGTIAVGSLATEAGLIHIDELAPLARDGYVARIADGRGAICGFRNVGTVYGTYKCLERLGVRFFAQDCEVVPKQDSLAIADCDLHDKPFFDYRLFYKLEQCYDRSPSLKLGNTMEEEMGDPSEIGEPGYWDHSSSFLVPYKTYGKTHPEYYALMKDGTRLHPTANKPFHIHLCLTNPDVRRISIERVLMLIGKQQERTYFTVSPGDGYDWCQCEKCKALDAVPGVNVTDRYLDFVNEVARAVAEKYPDKKIMAIAYTEATSTPPTRVKPEPNVFIVYCTYPPHTRCHLHDLTCEQNSESLRDIEDWLKLCPGQVGIFDYPKCYSMYYEPFNSFYAMKRKVDYYASKEIRFIGWCVAPRSFLDLFLYVQSQQAWDPKVDVESMIDSFMVAYYGPAAGPMREYFNVVCREIDERPVHQNCEGGRGKLVTAEFADRAYPMLDRARTAVAGDPVRLERVELEKFCVLWSDIQQRNPRNRQLTVDLPEFVRRLAEAVRIAKAQEIVQTGHSSIPPTMTDWLDAVAAAKLTTDPWYDDPWVTRLLADPQSILPK